MDNETETKSKAGAVIIPVTLFEQNCTLIWCTATRKAVVIDPGGDVPKILRAIEQSNVMVEKIWLTHGHIDHVGGAAELRDALKVPIEGPHIDDKYLLDNVVSSGARFGMTGVRDFAPARWGGGPALPAASHETLINSITTKLMPLGDDISFVCGHGAGSTFGQERL